MRTLALETSIYTGQITVSSSKKRCIQVHVQYTLFIRYFRRLIYLLYYIPMIVYLINEIFSMLFHETHVV